MAKSPSDVNPATQVHQPWLGEAAPDATAHAGGGPQAPVPLHEVSGGKYCAVQSYVAILLRNLGPRGRSQVNLLRTRARVPAEAATKQPCLSSVKAYRAGTPSTACAGGAAKLRTGHRKPGGGGGEMVGVILFQ